MNALVNKVQLIGQLGADPEIKTIDKNRKLAKFRLATNEYYKNSEGEKITDTQWHSIVAWGSLAELVEKYLHKGERIGMEGRLTTQKYEDKEGNNRVSTEVTMTELLLLENKKK